MSHVYQSLAAGFGVEIGLVNVVGEYTADGDEFCRAR